MLDGKTLMQSPVSRRGALKFGAGVMGCAACGVTMTGCGEANLDGPVTLQRAAYPELEEIGGIATVPTSDSGFKFKIFIHRRGEDDYISFSSECTHFGCEVALKDSRFVCPCHDSEFDLDGKVTKKPAKQDLVSFNVARDDAAGTITLSPK